MQTRKFDEMISYFNRKVSDMYIDRKYKMELLAMITAIGMAHEKELDAQLEQRWIPCSERLPEVGTYVLISKKALGFRSNLPSVCTAHRTHDPRSGKEEWNDMLFGKLNDDDVLAWMSLPEPYEER